MKSKLWDKLFKQATPFFVMTIFILTFIVVLWSLLLCSFDLTNAIYAIDLAKEFVIGVIAVIVAFVFGTAFDHWLQDKFNLDNDGMPRKDENNIE